MKCFSYLAYDQQGLKQKGELYAGDESQARKNLEDRSFFVVDLAEREKLKKSFRLFSSVNDELELVASELSLLLNNGMRIDRALELLIQSGEGRQITDHLSNVLGRVRSGMSLSDSLKEEGIFDRLFVSLVDLGEKTGRLGDVFLGLAADLKFRKNLKKKITQALTYPALIFSVCVGALLFIFNFIIPRMSGMFEGVDQLPIYTELMLGFSNIVREYQFIALMIAVPLILGFSFFKEKFGLGERFDAYYLRLPGLKRVVYRLECIRFASAMQLTLRYGITLESALQLAAMTVKNSQVREKLLGVRQSVRQGTSLAVSLGSLDLFPAIMKGLLSAGEESATLKEVFSEVADRSRQDFEDWVLKLTSLLEPLMIVIMGLIVGTIVIVMLFSIISVQDINF